MKKLLFLSAIVGLFALSSCEGTVIDDGKDHCYTIEYTASFIVTVTEEDHYYGTLTEAKAYAQDLEDYGFGLITNAEVIGSTDATESDCFSDEDY